jgi:hypothetical protein
MATYTLISSNVLSSSAASVTFSAIPATYTDLVVRASTKTDAGGTYGSYNTLIELNADATTLYSRTDLSATYDGSANLSLSSRGSAESYVTSKYTAELANPTSVFSSYELYIPSYTASQSKPMASYGVAERNATSIDGISVTAGLYRSNTAITQIKLSVSSSANWVTGSSFYLYGISNA